MHSSSSSDSRPNTPPVPPPNPPSPSPSPVPSRAPSPVRRPMATSEIKAKVPEFKGDRKLANHWLHSIGAYLDLNEEKYDDR